MELLIAGTAMGGRLASLDMVDLILQAGLIVKLVLLLLVVFSVVSWTIIALKWREFARAAEDGNAFLEVYHSEPLDTTYEVSRELDASPLAVIFLAGCTEMRRLAKESGRSPSQLAARDIRDVSKRLAWVAADETHGLERGLTFLATTGSTAPFIGLFGTVIGIISAFQSIGQAGSASLAVVAPGIAEALIATAVGLLAAIPATVFYNYYTARIEQITASIELFIEQFEGDLGLLAHHSDSPSAKVVRASGE